MKMSQNILKRCTFLVKLVLRILHKVNDKCNMELILSYTIQESRS